MKKEWIAPMIEDIDLASTAFTVLEGTQVDGQYENELCEIVDAYES